MGTRVTIEFEGLKELQKAIEQLAYDTEIRAVNREIFQRCADITEPRMKSHMARSNDNSKSGRKGYRPSGHAQDNIPIKVNSNYGEVGWELLKDRDCENWFYMKFIEWGTTNTKPQREPRDFLYNTRKESDSDYARIADEEYQKLLDAKLGG